MTVAFVISLILNVVLLTTTALFLIFWFKAEGDISRLRTDIDNYREQVNNFGRQIEQFKQQIETLKLKQEASQKHLNELINEITKDFPDASSEPWHKI